MKLLHRKTAGLLLLLLLTASCATITNVPAPQDFLHSTNAAWNRWADQVVDVHFTEIRVAHFPLTDAFSGLRMVIARADAPIDSLQVTLHAQDVTRRQALWLISRKYHLKMTIVEVRGQSPYLNIAKE